ncbi:hypothetical protein ACQPUY_17655, partial [Clostridium nigeriense]
TVASDDGGITIVGPTMQFKDKSNKVRIQMGQDTQGNFNFILRGEDGTTTLIDHTGIKEKAIADDLIKSNMVAADAIGEKQINYSSLITGLNKDTNTSLIQASKVAIDFVGQSLEVAFNTLKTNVDGINSTVESNTTAINVAQGEIEGIIKESSVVKNDITTLSDKYTNIKTTVDGVNITVSKHESSIENINGDVSTLKTKVNTVEQKVTATAITTTISNAINAGTSSITTTQFVMDKTGFTVKNGAIKIQNKAGTNVLTSDTSGNLTITGTFINKNSNGVKAIEINNTNIYFYDWERNARELGIIYSSYLTDYPNVRGFSFAHNQQGYMTLGYRTGSNSFGSYMTFDKYSINPTYAAPIRVHESALFHGAVNLQDRVYIPNKLLFESGYSATTPQIFKNTGDSRNILCTQVSVNAANDGYMIQTNTGGVLFSILAGRSYPALLNTHTQVSGNFTVTGS